MSFFASLENDSWYMLDDKQRQEMIDAIPEQDVPAALRAMLERMNKEKYGECAMSQFSDELVIRAIAILERQPTARPGIDIRSCDGFEIKDCYVSADCEAPKIDRQTP